MLIVFHFVAILIQQLLRKRRRHKPSICHSEEIDSDEIEHLLRFDPPVFRQRLAKIYDYLLDERWRKSLKKLVDFGCAEYGLFRYIKCLTIEEVLFVDIDEEVLTEKIGIIQPLLMDQLRKRSSRLEAIVYRGSMVDPDYRLRKTDVVTALEVIEHLYPDTLEALPYNIFSFIRPKLVFFTTPNADFNVVFNRAGFRHPDHKFEWTRNQFEDWCSNLTQRFPDYTVQYFGVGELQNQPPNIGLCSQGAIFIRKDLLEEKYISPIYARSCHCDNTSPCKGQTTVCKMQCNCICTFCLPDFSVGICTYLSCNVDEKEAYRPMKKSEPNRALSDSCLDVVHDYMNFPEQIEQPEVNPAYNIYYKLLQRVEYPFEVDDRSEDEIIADLLKYRTRAYGFLNSRFYVEDKERCEIPIRDLMYDVHLSADEVRRILILEGIQVELCQIPETGDFEYCVISLPHEMEEPTSSEDSSANSARSETSELSKANVNVGSLSDWDTTEENQPSEQGPTTSLDPPKPLNPDPLFDSGYLQSPSPLEANAQLPQLPLEHLEAQETDEFNDVGIIPRLNRYDYRDYQSYLKQTPEREKLNADIGKTKIDPNRVNELDQFDNNCLKPPLRQARPIEIPRAVPSSQWRPTGIQDREQLVPLQWKKKPTSMDDAKSLTNCIIENTLNKIEQVEPSSPYIEDNVPVVIDEDIPVAQLEHELDEAAPVAVENGDLANNNRDNEGNNLEEYLIDDLDADEGIDLINDNLEDAMPNLEDNVNINNNEPINEQEQMGQEAPNEEVARVERAEVEENLVPNPSLSSVGSEDFTAIGQASREVLFDQDSQIDLLDDFDIPQMPTSNSALEIVSNAGGSLEIETPLSANDVYTNTNDPGYIQIPIDFPPWLMQLLDEHEVEVSLMVTQDQGTGTDLLFSQGDGFGRHPSFIAMDIIRPPEEADNDDSDDFSQGSQDDSADLLLMQQQLETDVSTAVADFDDPLTCTLMEGALIVEQIVKDAEAAVTEENPEPGPSTSSVRKRAVHFLGGSPQHIPYHDSFLSIDSDLSSESTEFIASVLSDIIESVATAEQGESSDAEKSDYFDTLDKSLSP